jgi:hypothetical protein
MKLVEEVTVNEAIETNEEDNEPAGGQLAHGLWLV